MARAFVRSLLLSVSLACLAVSGPAFSGSAFSAPPRRQAAGKSDLTVHEWGTFTSIADRSGQAVKWYPTSAPSDLPSFVEHFRTADFKGQLQGTVRMETPVLYFYSPAEITLSVKVGFSKGVITEWYPHASHLEPNPRKILSDSALLQNPADGSIEWNAVTLTPGLAASFPRDKSEAHYYAARETSATPLMVRTRGGTQQEKFLFYRGVSVFSVPLTAQAMADGKVLVKNLGQYEVPGVILFERRGVRLGYRMGGALRDEVTLDPPELNSTVESLGRDLEAVLTAQGLYGDEARAMIETWKLSWFEEGSRVFCIVPSNFVNSVLPLAITPAPAQTVRVFVGRMEVITPATERAVDTALAIHDRATIAKYGRFLQPILEQMKAAHPSQAAELDRELTETYNVELVEPAAK